jgi:predicted nucleic acid-binding protein
MNVVDSSGWLEYLVDGPHAEEFLVPLSDIGNLIVPTICLYEVFKVVLRERGEEKAVQAIALMLQGNVVDLNDTIAVQAAKISLEKKLPMADSIVIATANAFDAVIWTQDQGFAELPQTRYFPKGVASEQR